MSDKPRKVGELAAWLEPRGRRTVVTRDAQQWRAELLSPNSEVATAVSSTFEGLLRELDYWAWTRGTTDAR